MKKEIKQIVLKYAKTQNSFIDEDGHNGFNIMIAELASYFLLKLLDKGGK